MTSCILVTGGAGYIGSHVTAALVKAGLDVVVLDNLCNSSARVLKRLGQLCGRSLRFVNADIRDGAALDGIFSQHSISGVIHLAAVKAVAESRSQPLQYFDNNVAGTISLLKAMERAQVRNIVFSSSATVYGNPPQVPVAEDAPLNAINPYGRTKLVCEEVLRDLQQADERWRIILLRYFNPVGAHSSGLIGEAPNNVPNNLMPLIAEVAMGRREYLHIFGSDYPTPDGTGVRDYVHVMDLARGHVAALDRLSDQHHAMAVNLGTGAGVSVKQLIDTFARVTGCPIAYRYAERRPGDVAVCYADADFARMALDWEAKYDVARMCEDTWRWHSMNPHGYAD